MFNREPNRVVTRWIGLIALLFSATLAAKAADNQPPQPIREIFVPFDDLHILLEGEAQRVFLTRQEYEDLLVKAQIVSAERAPQSMLLLSAEYDTTIQQQRALMRGVLWVEVLEPGLQALPLEISGVGVRRATLDGEPASLGRDDQGRLLLFVEGVGRRQLELDLVMSLQATAAQQSLQFQVPTPAATKLRLSVPGNVEVRSGASVVQRSVDEAAGITRFELLPQRGSQAIVMSLNNRVLQERRIVMARSVMMVELTQGYERLHATMSLDVLQGAVETFRFRVPNEFEVTEVESSTLSRWVVTADETGARILEANLREPTTGTVVLHITAIHHAATGPEWTMPRLEPLDVLNHVAVVGVLAEDRLAIEAVVTESLIPIDHAVVLQALPESLSRPESGAARVRPVLAFYAPQADYLLTARFIKPAARVDVRASLLLTLSDQGHRIRGLLTLVPHMDKLFATEITIPAEWHLASVTNEDGTPLVYEQLTTTEDQRTRWLVKLPASGVPGAAVKLMVEASHTPVDWFEEWRETAAAFPVIAVTGAASSRGAIAIRTENDLLVRPDQLNDLTPLDNSERAALGLTDAEATLAYRIHDTAFAASFVVERAQPRITARTFSFLRIEPDGLTAHYEIAYDVQRARTRRLSFDLPEHTPATLSIRGLDGVEVKEYISEVVEDQRRWTALLAQASVGLVRLAVDFQQPLAEAEPRDWNLPLAVAANVAYQSAIVAVEGSPGFDIQVETTGRKVDVGEMVDADYRVGRRLLGAYGFIAEPRVVAQVVRRPGYGLPMAITERAELVTVVAANGQAQTAARYLLRTKAAYLQIRLPVEATLWSVVVDGKPATPQRDADDLLISLPPAADRMIRDLHFVYATPANSLAMLSDIETSAPRLAVRTEESEEPYEVPTADVQWQLVLPEGHRVVRSRGSVFVTDSLSQAAPLRDALKRLYVLSGGIRPWYLLNIAAPMATQSRVATDSSPAPNMFGITDGEAMMGGFAVESQSEIAEAEALSAPFAAPAAPANEPMPADETKAVDLPAVVPQRASAAGLASPSREGKYWALQGVRSLQIELERSGDQVTFISMGVRPRIQATLIDVVRWNFLAYGLALLAGLWGLLLTKRPVRRQAGYVIGLGVTALAFPLLIGLATGLELSVLGAPIFYVAVALIPYYLLIASVKGLVHHNSPSYSSSIARGVAVVLLASMAVPGLAQENGPPALLDPAELARLLQPGKPIVLPQDAVILPYNPTDPLGVQRADQVLVPYAEYTRLWNQAFPDKPVDLVPPPAPYAFGDARYLVTVTDSDHLTITGHVDLVVYQSGSHEIPLPLVGGVLARATVDQQPARLRIMTPLPNVNPAANQQAAVANPPEVSSIAMLHVSGIGRKRIELSILLPIQRTGGWRIVQGKLPSTPATLLTLTVEEARTEVRLTSSHDRSHWETNEPNEAIETALSDDGVFNLQWRPTVAMGQVDQTLTAQSLGVLDIREDGVRLAWQLELQTRSNQRESVTLQVPSDYLVEQLVGDNVRGWQTRIVGEQQQVDVTLLKPAVGTEKLNLRLSHRTVVGIHELTHLKAPVVTVPDAVLHPGQLVIRRGPLLDLRTERVVGARRADVAPEALANLLATVVDESPLELRPFEAYRFNATSFTLELSARAHVARVTVDEQTLLRVAEREVTFESRLNLDIQQRPLHQIQIRLPSNLELTEVMAPGMSEWAVTTDEGGRLLTVFFGTGALNALTLDLRGSLERDDRDLIRNPRCEVLGATRQSGFVVVQASVDVVAEQIRNAEQVSLTRVAGWLAEPQRAVARLAIQHTTADYDVSFRLNTRISTVNAFSVTNVRVTPHEIEETIQLQFRIQGAGIREVAFQLPASLRDAQIRVPLLRQTTIEPIPDDPNSIHVRLELQDDIIGELVVLVQNSRALTNEIELSIPRIETGTTDHRFAVLESAGRDEVVVTNSDDFVELNRQLAPWKQLSEILPGNITRAYVARAEIAAPQLTLATKMRAMVETAGARIGLAETLLVVDANGAYRGSQEYRVDNKTEQFLEIELPQGAELWTVRVAGEAVKPTTVANATDRQHLRVPLIKTQTGDLDYPVVLQYGGDLQQLHSLRKIDFPLMRAVNVNVEQSHVRLRLPETRRWLNFSGTMRRVEDTGELAADFVSYQTRQVERLLQVMNNDSYDVFSKVRAQNNIKQLGLASSSGASNEYDSMYNSRLQRELLSNSRVLQDAQKQLQQPVVDEQLDASSSNRFRLSQNYDSQAMNRSNNIVSGLGDNFRADVSAAETKSERSPAVQQFNEHWFDTNQLGRGKQPQAAMPESLLAENFSRKKLADIDALDAVERFDKLSETDVQNKKLEQSAHPPVSGPSGVAEQVQRYQQRLEAEGYDPAVRGRQSGPAPQFAEDRGRGEFERRLNLEQGARSGGGQVGGFGGGGAALADFDAVFEVVQAPATGLASLDVTLPERGVEYLFTMPRGDIQISARSVNADQVQRVFGLMLILVGIAVLMVAFRIARALVIRIGDRTRGILLLLLGGISVLVGIFPVLGIMAIIAGVIMLIRAALTKRDSVVAC